MLPMTPVMHRAFLAIRGIRKYVDRRRIGYALILLSVMLVVQTWSGVRISRGMATADQGSSKPVTPTPA